MSDNVIANPGSGGATFRALQDSANVEHSAAVLEYATTISPGNNVLQPVTPANGLPIQPATGANFSYDQTDAVFNGSTSCTPQFSSPANVATGQTDSVLIAATSGKRVRVLALTCVCG